MLNRQDVLWAKATSVTRQALSQRLLSFPYSIFERVFKDLMPQLKARWAERTRPITPSISYALKSSALCEYYAAES